MQLPVKNWWCEASACLKPDANVSAGCSFRSKCPDLDSAPRLLEGDHDDYIITHLSAVLNVHVLNKSTFS